MAETPTHQARHCSACGTRSREGARFCASCGSSVSSAPLALRPSHDIEPVRRGERLARHSDPEVYESDARNWAMASHLSGLAFPIVGPLFVLLVRGSENPFVAQHAREALNAHITFTFVSVIGYIGIFMTLGLGVFCVGPVLLFLAIAYLVYMIQGTTAASRGANYRYSYIWRLVQ